MGGAVSAGEDNDDLIDNLVEADYIKTPHIEQIFRCVDRADYYLPDHKDSAYKDLAWKHGNIHLSAPCIYSEVMESLKLEPKMSFLNIGSGTGYLNTLAGLVLGSYGINHGVEYHEEVVTYAKQKLEHFKKYSDAFDQYDFCDPQFVTGNCLLFSPGCRLYDRVYCGAACPVEHENYMKNLIKVGGVLVMPLHDQLLQITRKSETKWESKTVLPVSFASLIVPAKDQPFEMTELPEANVLLLQEICRLELRRIMHEKIEFEHPQNGNTVHRKRKRKRVHNRQINIVPMSMGMMILGTFADSDEEQLQTSREESRESGEDFSDYSKPGTLRTSYSSSDEGIAEEENSDEIEAEEEEEEKVNYESDGQASGFKDFLKSARNNNISSNQFLEDGGSSSASKRELSNVTCQVALSQPNDGPITIPIVRGLGGENVSPTHLSCSNPSDTSGIGTSYEDNENLPDIDEETEHSSHSFRRYTGRIPTIKFEDVRPRREQRKRLEKRTEDRMEVESDNEEISKSRLKYQKLMREKMDELPIPQALKSYLLFYRDQYEL